MMNSNPKIYLSIKNNIIYHLCVDNCMELDKLALNRHLLVFHFTVILKRIFAIQAL